MKESESEKMVYSALTIAEYVLYYAKMKGYGLSSLQLLKILYFVQAQFLVFKKMPAFADKMAAASWGPVVKSVWDRYSAYGNAFIPVVNDNAKLKILTEDAKLIEEIEDLLLGFSNSSLLDVISQQEPFKKGRRNAPDCEIKNSYLQEFFK